MSYDHRLLCERVSLSLYCNPNSSLTELSRELHVSRTTLQSAVIEVTGKKFKALRDELFLAKVNNLLASRSNATIREVALEVGYKSPRSFARAVRRASGASPQQLRARIAPDLRACKARA